MAATDQTYRNWRARDIAFAVSCLLLLGCVFWTSIQDRPLDYWDSAKAVPLNSMNFSAIFWLQWFGQPLDSFKPRFGNFGGLLVREVPGIVLVLLYLFALPPLLAYTVLRPLFVKMGFARFIVLITLLQFLAAPHIRTVLRRTMNLKYIVAIPEYFFSF